MPGPENGFWGSPGHQTSFSTAVGFGDYGLWGGYPLQTASLGIGLVSLLSGRGGVGREGGAFGLVRILASPLELFVSGPAPAVTAQFRVVSRLCLGGAKKYIPLLTLFGFSSGPFLLTASSY